MSARDAILRYLTGQSLCPPPRPVEEATRLLDAYRADVLAERQTSTAREKSSREAIATPRSGDPTVVHWDRTVIHPEADPTDDTIVCCLTDDGAPVALLLDDEHREALGLILVDPTGENEVATPELTGRLAQLLDAVRTQGGEWTTHRGQAIYRALGDRTPLRTAVRKDLQALHAMGHLVQHEQRGRHFYTLNTRTTQEA